MDDPIDRHKKDNCDTFNRSSRLERDRTSPDTAPTLEAAANVNLRQYLFEDSKIALRS